MHHSSLLVSTRSLLLASTVSLSASKEESLYSLRASIADMAIAMIGTCFDTLPKEYLVREHELEYHFKTSPANCFESKVETDCAFISLLVETDSAMERFSNLLSSCVTLGWVALSGKMLVDFSESSGLGQYCE